MYRTTFGQRLPDPRRLLGYVQTDPSARYARFREILGKGAMKVVYKAFDQVLGMEVAWNQVQLTDVFHSPENLQRLYSEVQLLKDLDHEAIMHFYTSWIDIDQRTFNFITEMFTSGTLREYRKKHPRVDIRAIKNWAKQILHGLAYLHSHNPPIIHRDLKCDNIFVNGHLGQVKIGDLGLAAILHGSQHAHSVIGTPEFMAPELYDEEYNELVDVYSFGMCVTEMLTSEYPYSECSNPAQIYKKVTSGKLPDAFYRIQDDEAQKFVERCIQEVSKRLSAQELLVDPFLASDDDGELPPIPRVPRKLSILDGTQETLHVLEAGQIKDTDMNITGTINPEDDTVFLRVQICPRDGNIRNVYFPFDIVNDTPVDVAVEMVKELEISEWEPLEIAKMIEETVSSLLPDRKEYDHQHSFYYEEDYVEPISQLFYSSSSHSSQASFRALNSSPENQLPCWHSMISGKSISPECLSDDDDTSSKGSLYSFKYSNADNIPGNEENCSSSLIAAYNAENSQSTRFCPAPGLSTSKNCHGQSNLMSASYGCYSSHESKKLSRNRSLVDLRSQLLHRSLLEEISK